MSVQLSYSSSNLLLGCEQRYSHYKVMSTSKDIDFEENYKAFNIGKAFHWILEVSEHRKPESISSLLGTARVDFDLEDSDVALVHAMVLKYLRGTKGDGLSVVKCEYKIDHPEIIGFIDLISKYDDGRWLIADLKTSAAVYPTTVKKLALDRQLSLYAYFAPEIAKVYGLDMDKFLGCAYRVTTKPRLKQKRDETYNEYVLRLADRANFHDFRIPIELMRPQAAFDTHMRLHKRALELHAGEEPLKNYNYCDSYFRPCEYWSHCHGKCFSEVEIEDHAFRETLPIPDELN